jgi:hypothetical protein
MVAPAIPPARLLAVRGATIRSRCCRAAARLGAYQAGVYEALAENGFAPDWVTGCVHRCDQRGDHRGQSRWSFGAVRLREFWERVSSGPAARSAARYSSHCGARSTSFGPRPRCSFAYRTFFYLAVTAPIFAPAGTMSALSFYDTDPLRETLQDSCSSTSSTARTCDSPSERRGHQRQFEVLRQLQAGKPARSSSST